MLNQKSEFSKALKIGTLCVGTYITNYVMRNILSVSSVNMLEGGRFTKDIIGLISSVYFMAYAFGQLINGWLGDRIKAKNMVSTGLIISGVSASLFPFLNNLYLQMLSFALNGFGLSMMRGPLVKTISENTLPKYARNCCVGFSVAGFCGPLIAAMIAAVLPWQWVFFVTALIMVFMGIISFLILTFYEKKGIIKDTKKEADKPKTSYIKMFLLDKFVMYIFVGALTEIVSASVMFWIPTYLSENLNFSAAAAGLIYSVISILRSLSPFLTIFIFKLIRERDSLLIKVFFFASCIFFALMNFISNVWINIIMLILSLMCVGCISSTLWSFYIPSLSRSGCVSSANGLFDFSGYIAASIANVVFANAVTQFGWTRLIYIWSALMLSGVIIAVICGIFPLKNKSNIERNVAV